MIQDRPPSQQQPHAPGLVARKQTQDPVDVLSSAQRPDGHEIGQLFIALRRLRQMLDAQARTAAKQFGLTAPQMSALRELVDSGDASAGELAKATGMGQATLTGILDRLENRGLVERERSVDDRRRVIVRATEAGRHVLSHPMPTGREPLADRFEALESWERTQILASVQRLAALMNGGDG